MPAPAYDAADIDVGITHVEAHLPSHEAPVTLLTSDVTAERLSALRHAVTAAASSAGLTGIDLEDFVLAVNELATNVVCHGGGRGLLRLRRDGERLTCEVSDHGPGMTGPVPELPDPDRPGGRGLWLAQHLTGGLTLNSGRDGLTATISMPIRRQP